MNYAVELIFDDESQNVINRLRKLLEDHGVHDEAVKLNHISIGDYSTDDIEGLKAGVLEFANRIRPFGITLCSVGTFMTAENVIFLAPVMTEELKSVHDKFVGFMSGFGGEYRRCPANRSICGEEHMIKRGRNKKWTSKSRSKR